MGSVAVGVSQSCDDSVVVFGQSVSKLVQGGQIIGAHRCDPCVEVGPAALGEDAGELTDRVARLVICGQVAIRSSRWCR